MTGESPIVYLGWTLEWEMFFYIVFGLSLVVSLWKHVIIIVGGVLVVISLFVGNFISMEFFFGMIIAYFFNNGFKISALTGSLVFLAGFILLTLSLGNSEHVTQTNRIVVWGIPSTLIVFGLLFVKQISNKFIIYLGDASYSIYLIQMLSIPAFYKVSYTFLEPINNDITALLCLATSITAGCLMYSFIESPITTKLKMAFPETRFISDRRRGAP